MPAQKLALVTAFLISTTSILNAAVFERDFLAPGDGLLTFDDVTQREWLDLTETLDWSLSQLSEAIAPQGPLKDFSLATVEDIAGMAASAGVEWLPPGQPFPVAEGNAASNLIDLAGTILDYSNFYRDYIDDLDGIDSTGPTIVYDDEGNVVGIAVDLDDLHVFNILDVFEMLGLRAAAGLAVAKSPQEGLLVDTFKLISVISIENRITPGAINRPLNEPSVGGGILSDLQAFPEPIVGPFWLVRAAVPEPSAAAILTTGLICVFSRKLIRR